MPGSVMGSSTGDDVHKEIKEYMKQKYEMRHRDVNQARAEEWIVKMLNDNVSFSSTWSIGRVPEKLRSVKNEAYDPQLASIGPIHYEDPRLRSMEFQKQSYLISLLRRTQPQVAMHLDELLFTILKHDEKVRACYADTVETDKIKLAKILLQDAGFMLELFLRCYDTDSRVPDDPVFTTTWMKPALMRDLALFENQIPFFVLETLYQFVFPPDMLRAVPSLNELVLRFYKSTLTIDDKTYREKCSFEGSKHLLHLLYNCYIPSAPETRKEDMETLKFIPNAMSLNYARVSFKRSNSHDLFDLEFIDGVFYIPTLHVDDATDSLFRNFIAIEQCQQGTPRYITSYCMLLAQLMDTGKDAEILVGQGIIMNNLRDGSQVSGVFNDICKQVVLKDFYFAELCDQMKAYLEPRWRRYRGRYMAELNRKYFKNPSWSTISFAAATILLVLTALQTIYTAVSYYKS